MRFLTLFSVVALSACTFGPADPWAELTLSLKSGIEVPASRQSEGAIKTSDNYLIDDLAVTFVFDTLEIQGGELAELTFDLANPPPGFSNCHNGHCHSDNGDLVDYKDVEATITGSVDESVVSLVLADERDIPLEGFIDISMPECPECALSKGSLSELSLTLREIHMSGTVRDVDATPRFEGNASFDFVVNVGSGPVVPLGEKIGPYGSDTLDVELTYSPSIGIVDLDWATLVEDGFSEENRLRIVSKLTDEEALGVNASRE